MQQLSEEARQRRNEYYRKWRKVNKERVKEINRRYWEKKTTQEKGEKDD